jgi:hypothetical protein
MEHFENKSKRRLRLTQKNKFNNFKRSGISRKGDPISHRCNDWKCIEFRKLKEVE